MEIKLKFLQTNFPSRLHISDLSFFSKGKFCFMTSFYETIWQDTDKGYVHFAYISDSITTQFQDLLCVRVKSDELSVIFWGTILSCYTSNAFFKLVGDISPK